MPVRVQGRDFELLVDTGAAYTALSKDVIALLGMSSDPQRTAAIVPIHGGILRVPIVTITELRVGGLRIANITAVVLDLPPALKFDGMLGMNVLKQFRVTIETDTGTLVLRPIGRLGPDPAEWIDFRKKQERPMKCLVCHHDMVERNVILDLRIGEDLVVIEDVPATVCENCSEQVFTPEVTRQVQAVAQERNERTRTILVPVFSFATP